MSFAAELKFVRNLYANEQTRNHLWQMQRSTTRLLIELNEIRVLTNFNGYERRWRTSQSYRSFRDSLEESVIPEVIIRDLKYSQPLLDRYADEFVRFVDNTLESAPVWFRTMARSHEANIKRFDDLIATAPTIAETELGALLFSSDTVIGERDFSMLARVSILEAALRLAQFSGGGGSRQFRSWLKGTFMILLCGSFSQGRPERQKLGSRSLLPD